VSVIDAEARDVSHAYCVKLDLVKCSNESQNNADSRWAAICWLRWLDKDNRWLEHGQSECLIGCHLQHFNTDRDTVEVYNNNHSVMEAKMLVDS
jgi:hypothetical protein